MSAWWPAKDARPFTGILLYSHLQARGKQHMPMLGALSKLQRSSSITEEASLGHPGSNCCPNPSWSPCTEAWKGETTWCEKDQSRDLPWSWICSLRALSNPVILLLLPSGGLGTIDLVEPVPNVLLLSQPFLTCAAWRFVKEVLSRLPVLHHSENPTRSTLKIVFLCDTLLLWLSVPAGLHRQLQ